MKPRPRPNDHARRIAAANAMRRQAEEFDRKQAERERLAADKPAEVSE